MTKTYDKSLQSVLDERARLWNTEGAPLAEIARERDFTAEEAEKWTRVNADIDAYTRRLDAMQHDLEQWRATGLPSAPVDNGERETWRNLATGERAALNPGESILQHPAFARARDDDAQKRAEGAFGTLGTMIRTLATGGTGAAVVPTTWASTLIDLARSKTAIGQAGATVIPMESGKVQIGRRTGDPTAAFRLENGVTAPSDPTFDSITLEAKTLTAYVTGSIEWFQDAAPNAESLVIDALAASIAQQIDLAAVYGGTTVGAGTVNLPTPPNPRGILATLAAVRPGSILGGGAANGTTPTVAAGLWNEVLDTAFTVVDANEVPNAVLWSSKLARQFAKAVDSTGQPVRQPEALNGLKFATVNKLENYTKGTLATASDLFVGDFRQLLLGERLQITITPMPVHLLAEGKVGVFATWRGDIALARPAAFAVHRALKSA